MYLDDIIILSKNVEEHLKVLKGPMDSQASLIRCEFANIEVQIQIVDGIN